MRKLLLIFSLITAVFWARPVWALDFTPPSFKDDSYSGKYYSQSVADPINLVAGQTQAITVRFKNTGTAAWSTTGNYVSVYTFEPSYRASDFADKSWLSAGHPAKISANTASGKIGEFTFTLKAPTTPGDYKEQFYLAAENRTWIKGGYFYLKIKVTPAPAEQKEKVDVSDDENLSSNDTVRTSDYQTFLLALTAHELTVARGGDVIDFKAIYVNSGAKDWGNYRLAEAGSVYLGSSPTVGKVNVADSSWESEKTVLNVSSTVVAGDKLPLEFSWRAPRLAGNYLVRFQLLADGHSLDGGVFEVPLTVTQDARYDYASPVFPLTRALVAEPNVRVGLYKDSKPVKFKSGFVYQIFDGPNYVGDLPSGEMATLSYNKGNYHFKGGEQDFDAKNFLRLVPINAQGYFELPTYTRQVSYKGKINFNVYRGVLEYVYSPKSDLPYIINELPLDQYVAGIAETGNEGSMEYLKSILVAARGYAFFHLNAGEGNLFDVYATTVDQLYLGYNSEAAMPRVAQAALATAGEMVTYQGNPVTTPYFGHSAGQTKTWKEVWGGADKPWLKSVECIYDQGKKLFGHGVGMSAADASARAAKDNWTYDRILGYYYTDTAVERIY